MSMEGFFFFLNVYSMCGIMYYLNVRNNILEIYLKYYNFFNRVFKLCLCVIFIYKWGIGVDRVVKVLNYILMFSIIIYEFWNIWISSVMVNM